METYINNDVGICAGLCSHYLYFRF